MWNQLDAPHVLPIPVRRRVQREARPVGGDAIGSVLVRRREVNVLVDGARAVDVVLVGADLVAPGPGVQVCRRAEAVEPAVPDDCTGVDNGTAEQGEGRC